MSKKPPREIVVVKLDDEDKQLKKKALEVWDRARLELVQWRPFLGVMAMQLEIIPVVDYRCRTASTDGRRVFCDADFILSRSEEDSLFILAHEVLHCALMHFTREKGKIEEHQMWNFAIDHEVNAVLQEDGLTVPKNAVLYRHHLGKSAEQVYQLLLEGKLEMLGKLMDDHEMEGDCKADGECDNCSGEGERDGGGVQYLELKMDPDFNPRRSDAVWREWAAKMANAARIGKERGWPSPRSWSRVSEELYLAEKIGMSERMVGIIVDGLVGIGAGLEFQGFRRAKMRLPDIKAMLKGEVEREFPKSADQRWALVTSIVPHLLDEGIPDVMLDGVMELVKQMEPSWVEFLIKDVCIRGNKPKPEHENCPDEGCEVCTDWEKTNLFIRFRKHDLYSEIIGKKLVPRKSASNSTKEVHA